MTRLDWTIKFSAKQQLRIVEHEGKYYHPTDENRLSNAAIIRQDGQGTG